MPTKKTTTTATTQDLGVFNIEVAPKLIAQAIYVYQANSHRGVANSKTRGDINASKRKIYKQKGGKKVIAAIPQSDKTFGIKHLEQFINSEIIDEKVNTGDWYKHDLIKGLLGNAVLYLGNSPGTNGELNYAVYLYKILTGRKEGVEIAGKFIHSEIRAGKDYTIFVYSPFLKSGKLSEELENYIRKFNISLVYINNPNQLRDKLRSF